MITVNTNVTAMNAARASDRAGDLLARSVERLSSGLRINSARDDSAGLAITNGQETIIRGETQARRGRVGAYLPVSVLALFIANMLAHMTGLFIPALPMIALVMLLWYGMRHLLHLDKS